MPPGSRGPEDSPDYGASNLKEDEVQGTNTPANYMPTCSLSTEVAARG